MPSLSRTASVLAVLVIVLAAPSPGLAENRHHSIEIGATAELTRFDTDAGLATETAPSLIVGFNFTKRHGLEVNYSTMTANPDNGTFDVDLDTLAVGYIYNAYPRERIVSFFRTGMGFRSQRPEDPDSSASERLESSDRNLFIFGGAGMRYFFNETIAFRFDGAIRFVDVEEGFVKPDVEGSIAAGVVFVLGGKDVEAPPDTDTE